jgi:ribosomal protein L11 methyltransferase
MLGARHSKGASVWRMTATVSDIAAAEIVAAAFGTSCGAVSVFDAASGGAFEVEGIALAAPQRGLVEGALALAWSLRAEAPPELVVERVPARDWLGENQASFAPIRVGRYFVHGSHHREGVPVGHIGLIIDAATAFGTGEHATTRACLMALDALARRRRARRTLDMGTGTGILAIAAAKTWRRRVLACDIDAEAVRVAARHAEMNGVAALVALRRADGYRGLGRDACFDVVFANILARPLAVMAPFLARALAPGGIAILSGLLARQEAYVLAAHRAQRLVLVRRVVIDGWHTLVLTRRSGIVAPAIGNTNNPLLREAR